MTRNLTTTILGWLAALLCCCAESGNNGNTPTGSATENDTSPAQTDSTTGDDDTSSVTHEDTGSGTGSKDTEPKPEQLNGNPCDAQSNPWDCSPVGNEGCDEGQTCAWTNPSKVHAFTCEEGRALVEGQTCNPNTPKCGPGLKCMTSIAKCVRMCCSDQDCDGTGFTCEYQDTFGNAITGGELGVCYRLQLSGNVCGGDNPWQCDPVTNDGCNAGSSCQYGSMDGGFIKEFACIPTGSLVEGRACRETDGILCEPGLACVDGLCRRFCCSDEECGQDVPCKYQAILAPNLTGGDLGFCVPSVPACPGVCTIQMDVTQYGFPVCENGTVYKGYFDCEEPDKTGCCRPGASEEIGKPCPVPEAGQDPTGFECKDAFGAVIGHCPAVHHEYLCPDKAGGKKQWCCEADPNFATAFAPEPATDTQTDTST